MTKNVLVTISGLHYDDSVMMVQEENSNEANSIEVTTPATYYLKNGKHYIVYDEVVEGIPGTIIDAYSAGVPVITARWINCKDVFDEDITGWSYEIDNYCDLVKQLRRLRANLSLFNNLKRNCIVKAKMFSPESIMKTMTSRIK